MYQGYDFEGCYGLVGASSSDSSADGWIADQAETLAATAESASQTRFIYSVTSLWFAPFMSGGLIH
jgi:hypothetical protein